MATNEPNAVYARARKLVNVIEYQLQQLEQAPALSLPAGPAASSREDAVRQLETQRQELSQNINLLANEAALLTRIVNDHTVALAADKRNLWRKRAAQLNAETTSLRTSVMTFMRNTFAELEGRKATDTRSKLLGDSAAGASAVAVDAMIAERSSLTVSHAMIDEFTSMAGNVLGSLRAQRGVLKSAHKKALDVATTLGMSSTLIRFIERRTLGDRIIVYGGMVVIMMLVVIVWWLVRR